MPLIYFPEVSTILPNYKSQKSIEMPQNKVLSVQDEFGVRIFIFKYYSAQNVQRTKYASPYFT